MLPLMPPLTAIEMLDNVCPSRLNCGQSIAAEVNSVGPLTVPQFTTIVLAEAPALNSNTAIKTKNTLEIGFTKSPSLNFKTPYQDTRTLPTSQVLVPDPYVVPP